MPDYVSRANSPIPGPNNMLVPYAPADERQLVRAPGYERAGGYQSPQRASAAYGYGDDDYYDWAYVNDRRTRNAYVDSRDGSLSDDYERDRGRDRDDAWRRRSSRSHEHKSGKSNVIGTLVTGLIVFYAVDFLLGKVGGHKKQREARRR